MFNVQTHTASAVHNARSAASQAEKATGKVASTMTALFVAFIAADPTLSLKAISTLVGEKVPQSKSGGVAAVHKSRANTFFKDDANMTAARAAIPSPEAMEPEAFQKAVETYAKGLNPRKWIEDRKATATATATAQEQAKADNVREPGDDEQAEGDAPLNAGFDPVLSAQTEALRAIANLREMLSNADAQVAEDALNALQRVFDSAGIALTGDVPAAIAA